MGQQLGDQFVLRHGAGTGLAHVQQGLGLHAPALALMDRARALGLDTPDFRYFRALQLQFNGRMDEVEAELDREVHAAPAPGQAQPTAGTGR